jgi:hypothetical protein
MVTGLVSVKEIGQTHADSMCFLSHDSGIDSENQGDFVGEFAILGDTDWGASTLIGVSDVEVEAVANGKYFVVSALRALCVRACLMTCALVNWQGASACVFVRIYTCVSAASITPQHKNEEYVHKECA